MSIPIINLKTWYEDHVLSYITTFIARIINDTETGDLPVFLELAFPHCDDFFSLEDYQRKTLKPICEMREILLQIPSINCVYTITDLCGRICVKEDMDMDAAIVFLKRVTKHLLASKNPFRAIQLLANNCSSSTQLLKSLIGGKKRSVHRGRFGWEDRTMKAAARSVVNELTLENLMGYAQPFSLADDIYKSYCLVFPGSSALDIYELSHGIINPGISHVTLIEKNKIEMDALQKNWDARSLGFSWASDAPVKSAGDKLKTVSLNRYEQLPGFYSVRTKLSQLPPIKCDFAWFDFTGHFTWNSASWVKNSLFHNLDEAEMADIWFTFSAVPRANSLINTAKKVMPAKVKKRIIKNIDWGDSYTTLEFEKTIITTIFLLEEVFPYHKFDIKVFHYRDEGSIKMLLVHLDNFEVRGVRRPVYLDI